jgi:hypothetical protein
MLLNLSDEDNKLYSKLYISASDIGYAQRCAAYLLMNKWHHKPWEKRGGIYFRQSAFTTALVVS